MNNMNPSFGNFEPSYNYTDLHNQGPMPPRTSTPFRTSDAKVALVPVIPNEYYNDPLPLHTFSTTCTPIIPGVHDERQMAIRNPNAYNIGSFAASGSVIPDVALTRAEYEELQMQDGLNKPFRSARQVMPPIMTSSDHYDTPLAHAYPPNAQKPIWPYNQPQSGDNVGRFDGFAPFVSDRARTRLYKSEPPEEFDQDFEEAWKRSMAKPSRWSAYSPVLDHNPQY